jgi:hypothetical protein
MTMKKFIDAKFAIMALLVIGGITTVYADGADHIDLPVDEPFDDQYCTFLSTGNHVIFTCSWKWFLPEYVMAELDPDDIPAKLSDIPQHNFDLSEQIKLLIDRGPPAPIEDPMELDFEEFLHPEEPLTLEQKQIVAALKKLDECRTGEGGYAAFMQQAAIEHYVNQSRYLIGTGATGYEEHQLMQIRKAIEACRILDKGPRAGTVSPAHYYAWLADVKGLDYLDRPIGHPLNPKVTDQSNTMIATDPLTDDDFKTTIEEAEKYLRDEAPWMDPTLGCQPTEDDPDRCVNRGGQTAGKPCDTLGQPAPIGVYPEEICPLDKYNQFIIDNADTITMDDILKRLCNEYLDRYLQTEAVEIPAWLNHCPIEDEENGN